MPRLGIWYLDKVATCTSSCTSLQLADDTIVTAGSVVVRHGTGECARLVKAEGDQMRRAVLVTFTGATAATANFS
jgi:hypothetical protein